MTTDETDRTEDPGARPIRRRGRVVPTDDGDPVLRAVPGPPDGPRILDRRDFELRLPGGEQIEVRTAAPELWVVGPASGGGGVVTIGSGEEIEVYGAPSAGFNTRDGGALRQAAATRLVLDAQVIATGQMAGAEPCALGRLVMALAGAERPGRLERTNIYDLFIVLLGLGYLVQRAFIDAQVMESWLFRSSALFLAVFAVIRRPQLCVPDFYHGDDLRLRGLPFFAYDSDLSRLFRALLALLVTRYNLALFGVVGLCLVVHIPDVIGDLDPPWWLAPALYFVACLLGFAAYALAAWFRHGAALRCIDRLCARGPIAPDGPQPAALFGAEPVILDDDKAGKIPAVVAARVKPDLRARVEVQAARDSFCLDLPDRSVLVDRHEVLWGSTCASVSSRGDRYAYVPASGAVLLTPELAPTGEAAIWRPAPAGEEPPALCAFPPGVDPRATLARIRADWRLNMRLLLLMAALAAGGLVVSLAGARSAACRRACDKIYDTCRFTLDPGVDKAACVKRCEQGRDPRAFARCVESRVCESRSIDACLEASGMPPLYPGQGRAPRGSRAGELCPR